MFPWSQSDGFAFGQSRRKIEPRRVLASIGGRGQTFAVGQDDISQGRHAGGAGESGFCWASHSAAARISRSATSAFDSSGQLCTRERVIT